MPAAILSVCPANTRGSADTVMAGNPALQVVVATGLYNDALGIPMHFRLMDVDGIAECYAREIEEGIGNTGIKAGIIKTASGGIHGVTPPGRGRMAPAHA